MKFKFIITLKTRVNSRPECFEEFELRKIIDQSPNELIGIR